MRAMLAAILITLAGCSTADPVDDALPDDPIHDVGPTVLDWSLSTCDAAVAIIPVDTAALAPYLPEGFRSVSLEEILGTGTSVQGGANLGVELLSCQEGAALNGTQAMVYGSHFSMVEPPEELAQDVTFHFVKWETLIPDDERRELLAGLGLPVVDGSVSIDLSQGDGPRRLVEGTMTLGDIDYRIGGIGLAPGDPVDFSFVEFMPFAGGLAQWFTIGKGANVGQGPALVHVPANGMLADVAGEGVHAGAAFAGVVTFHGGNVTIPVF